MSPGPEPAASCTVEGPTGKWSGVPRPWTALQRNCGVSTDRDDIDFVLSAPLHTPQRPVLTFRLLSPTSYATWRERPFPCATHRRTRRCSLLPAASPTRVGSSASCGLARRPCFPDREKMPCRALPGGHLRAWPRIHRDRRSRWLRCVLQRTASCVLCGPAPDVRGEKRETAQCRFRGRS